MSNEEDIFKAVSDFMKGKAGSFDTEMAKLVMEGDLPPEALMRPKLSSTFSDFSEEYSLVVSGIAKCSLEHCLKIVGSMLTLPEFQCNDYRLRVLVHLAFMHAKGKKRPTASQVVAWFNQLDGGTCARQEDPTEDVFISRVFFGTDAFRLFEGCAEGNGFHTQIFLSILEDMPDQGIYGYLKSSALRLLMLSELIASRTGLPANIVGTVSPVGHIEKPTDKVWADLNKRVVFSAEEIEKSGLTIDSLRPFFPVDEELNLLADYSPGCSPLDMKVLFEKNHKIIVHTPNLIGTAIRAFVIHTLQQAGMLDQLHKALANAYASLFMSEGFIDVRPPPIRYQETDGYHISQVITEVDAGRYLHLLFFIDGFDAFEKGGFTGINNVDEISKIVDVAIRKAHESTSKKEGFREGLTIVVGCGWGRGLGLGFMELPENWRSEVLPAHDAVTLTKLPNFDYLDVWKTLDALDAIENAGIHLSNANGFLNLIAWIRNNNGHIVPHEKLDDEIVDEREGFLALPINSNLNARVEALQATDSQMLQRPDGTNAKIRRVHSTPQFGCQELSPFYVDMEAIREKTYRSVYLGQRAVFWIEATTDSTVSLEFRYHLCNMIMHWAEEVFRFFDERTEFECPASVSCKYHFIDVEEPQGNEPIPGQNDFEEMIERVDFDSDSQTVSMEISNTFAHGARRIDNLAERYIVKSLVEYCAEVFSLDIEEKELNAFVNAIVRNDQARHVHAFAVPKTRDYVRDDLPKPLTIERADDANSRIGLGWFCREKSEGNKIEGVTDCKQYLRDLVQALVESLKTSISRFNRLELITRLLLNHEALFADLDTWKRTYGPIQALSEDEALAAKTVSEKLGGINASSMSCRIICEVAICECPVAGGIIPGAYDIQTLMTQASLLHHMGGYSDAIDAGMMPSEIRISPGGDVLMNHDFTDDVVRPFGESFQTKSLRSAAKRYSENYKPNNVQHSGESDDADQSYDEKMFEEAWLSEFGFSLDEFKLILWRFQDMLEIDREAIKHMPLARLSGYLIENTNVHPESLDAFLQTFSLRPREKWDEAPEGMLNISWQPWRFQRQLSLVAKPIIIFDDTEEAECIVAPAMVVESLVKFVTDARTGAIDQKFFRDNELMFKWNGTINGREGEAFNDVVAKKFRGLGWKAEANLSDGQLLNRKKDPSFGDVDVFAWDENTKRVLVIECKDLSFDKTIGEISRRLIKYKGEKRANGKADDLLKHINRCEELEKSIVELQKTTGFMVEKIERVLLFSQSTPMQFSGIPEKFGVKVCVIDEIQTEFEV